MAISRVNSTTQSLASGSSQSVTLGWTLTADNFLVVIVTGRSSTATHTVTATGSTITQQFIQAASGGNARTSYNTCKIGSAVSSITVASNSAIVKAVTVIEYSGVAGTVSTVDQKGTTQGAASATQNGQSLVTTNADDVIIESVSSSANTGATYATAGPSAVGGTAGTWQNIGNIGNSGGTSGSIGQAVGEVIASATDTYQATWTAGASTAYVGAGIALQAAIGVDLVQTKQITSSGTNPVTGSFTNSTVAGNLLVVAITNGSGTSNYTTVSDNKGNTWSRVFSTITTIGGADVELWYSLITTGGASHQISMTNSSFWNMQAICREYSGVTSAPLDKTTNATGNSTALNSGASATTTQAAELVIGIGGDSWGSGQSYTAGVGFGNLSQLIDASAYGLALEDKTVSSTGAQTAAFTLLNSWRWACGVATFKVDTGGGATFVPQPRKPILQAVNRASTY